MAKTDAGKVIKKLSKNYWAISTIILAALLIVVLVINQTSSISESAAAEKTLSFLNAQTGGGVELVEVNDADTLYEVIVSYEGQEIPVYVTKDGKNMVQGVVPLTGQVIQDNPPQTPTPTNIPKSDKPVVELFIMSHCPYGTQAEKGIIPVVNLLGDKIDFKLKFVYYAMHGEVEVKEQLNQYCIQKEQNTKFIPYLECFLTEGKGDGCLVSTGIDKTKLKTCTDATDKQYNVIANLEDTASWLSGRYPKFDIHKADNEKYSVGGSPTLIINGQDASSGRDAASLLDAVCAAFNTAPEECATELSSASPSPGFGYTTTTGATTTAQCG